MPPDPIRGRWTLNVCPECDGVAPAFMVGYERISGHATPVKMNAVEVVPVPDEQAIERAAAALYDLREHEGVRPPVSTWPPADPDEADDYRLEARAVLTAAHDQPER